MHKNGMRGGSRPRGGGFRGGPFAVEWSVDGPPRGRRRMFDGGELKLVLLSLIADAPRHGYDLIRALEERSGGAYAPSPGVVYPTLTLLADMGHIDEQAPDAAGSGSRKRFAITAEGQAHLDARSNEVAALFARIDALAKEREKTSATPVRRAMHNLRQVLLHKLGEEGEDREKLHAIVALIDETAGRIERL